MSAVISIATSLTAKNFLSLIIRAADIYIYIFLYTWWFFDFQFSTLSGWLVSDLAVSRTVLPSLDTETKQLSVGNYELPGVESYFWLAPENYLGNLLTSYGSNVSFSVSWVVMRGDTSGRPTVGPNMVLIVSAAWGISVMPTVAPLNVML